jgi:diguanylate cyclase (GGDEF)-like protein
VTAPRAPLEIAPRVWWVSGMLPDDRFQCHAYLIEQGNRSVLIDPGSALTADAVVTSVEQVVGTENLRWLVCSHADPDIIAAVPTLLAAGLSPDAAIVTHWRDEALMRHLGWPLPFVRVDELGWRLELEDRALRFVFTPYVHFAGAFCSFDERSGTLFSSDLFGAFSDDDALVARPDSSLAGMRRFHEHYMPSREALAHSVDLLRGLPIERIAPQHGQVIPAELVPRVFEEVASWECGLYLEVGEDPGLSFLFAAHRTLHDLAQLLLEGPDFPSVAEHLAGVAEALLGAVSLELWARAGGEILVFDAADGFAGRRAVPPVGVQRLLDGDRADGDSDDSSLLVPLATPGSPTVEGVAVVTLGAPPRLDTREQRLLDDVAALVATAVRREVTRRLGELDRAELYEQAVRDGLTGLHNRFYLRDVLPRMLAGSDRDGAPISILMVDIDHFKKVNDEYGHLVGDEVLRHVARAISEVCRAGDLAVRFGGEEFLVVLSGAAGRGAPDVAARLREAVAQASGQLPPVTVSVGVAERRLGESGDDVISRADCALYDAKAAGRDRAHVAT